MKKRNADREGWKGSPMEGIRGIRGLKEGRPRRGAWTGAPCLASWSRIMPRNLSCLELYSISSYYKIGSQVWPATRDQPPGSAPTPTQFSPITWSARP